MVLFLISPENVLRRKSREAVVRIVPKGRIFREWNKRVRPKL